MSSSRVSVSPLPPTFSGETERVGLTSLLPARIRIDNGLNYFFNHCNFHIILTYRIIIFTHKEPNQNIIYKNKEILSYVNILKLFLILLFKNKVIKKKAVLFIIYISVK